MYRPPWWFQCCFCRSSWIHCWLLLAVLSNYFGHLVTSTFLLCKFRGLPGSTPVSFPVMSRWKCLGIKTSSQPSGTTPGKRAEKTYRSGSRREASNAKSRKSLFYFKPEKSNKFEYCNNLWKQNIEDLVIIQCGNWKRDFTIICMRCVLFVCKSLSVYINLCEGINYYKSLPKHETIIEKPDNIIQDFKTVRLGFSL